MTVTDDFTKVEVVHLFGIPNEKLPSYQHKEPIGEKPTEVARTLNVPLLLQIMAFIKDHPSTWYQDDWFMVVDRDTGQHKFISDTTKVEELNSCGTSFCFAGHVALAEGFASPPKNNHATWQRIVQLDDGSKDYERVEDFAMKRLGINYGQSDALFGAGNTMVDLDRMVQTLILFPGIEGYHLEEVRDLNDDDRTGFRDYLIEMALKYVHKN